MPNYANGKIYTIRFYNSNEIYIGSTIQSLAVRFGGHKRQKNTSIYYLVNSKYNDNWDECYYELFENFPCNNRNELCKREGEVTRIFMNDANFICINMKIECRTRKEYKKDNPDMIKEEKKKYYERNADKIKEKSKQYRKDNPDKIKQLNQSYYKKIKDKKINEDDYNGNY